MKSKNRPLAATLISLSVLTVSAVLAAVPAAAQNCSNVSFRLWTQGGETWHRFGETVQIESGTEGHIYLHVDGRGSTPYSTSADVGYPDNFGIGGVRSTDVVRHVRMKQQSGEDRSTGRIRFDAVDPGSTLLGYRLAAVRSPGTLDSVAPGCRTGAIRIQVVARGGHGGQGGGQGGGRPGGDGDQGSSQEQAAREVVSRLYRGLLRRADAGRLDEGFVDSVQRGGRDGVLQVAEVMVASSEFRQDALRLTEQAHGRSNLDRLRRQLLDDIYRDLYGYAEPDDQGRQDDLQDLETCLSTERNSQDACRRLGRELVNRRQYYEYNRQLIDALVPSRRRGFGP